MTATGLTLTLTAEQLDTLADAVAERIVVDQPAAAEPWLTVDQLSEHLACKPRRVYDLVSQRRIPFVKDGSRVLFRASEVDATFERSFPVQTPAAKPRPRLKSEVANR